MNGTLVVEALHVCDRALAWKAKSDNLFVTQGYDQLARLLGNDLPTTRVITQMQFGTGVTVPNAVDTTLQQPITPTKVIAPITYVSAYEVTLEAFLLADEANGFTLFEAGLLTSANVLVARVTHSGVTKTSDFIFHFTWHLRS